jgi:zinc protease
MSFTTRRSTLAARLAWVAAALLAAGCSLPAARTPDPRTMSFPPVTFVPPRPERRVLGNGMVVYLLEDHEVPLVEGRALVRAGSVLDPPGKTGLARLTGQVLVRGGTVELPGERLDGELENRAIEMGADISNQSGSVTLDAPAADLDTALVLLAGVLRNPAFEEGRFEQAKRRMIEETRRQGDDPGGLAYREFRRLLYAGDPRGRTPTAADLEALTRADTAALHRELFRPDRIILGFSGDFRGPDLLARLEALFGDWSPSGLPPPPFPVPDPAAADRGLAVIDKDLAQATVILGRFAPPRESDDHIPFMIADYILGSGGFNSRLTREIRSNRGLAYSAGSFYRGDNRYGVFVASCQTANGTAAEAFGLMAGEIGRMQIDGVTADELAWARDSILNAMVFRYASSAAVVAEAMGLEYDGLPADFTARVAERLRTVDAAAVSGAAARWLDPGAGTAVVLGRESELGRDWSGGRTIRRYRVEEDGRVVPSDGP